MILRPDDRILFTGDSVTNAGRTDALPFGANGYVALTVARLQAHFASSRMYLFNRGISGNRVRDLVGRLDADLIDLRPTVVSIMIGINDTWRRYDGNDPTSISDYEAQYRTILTRIRRELTARVVLIEPFVLHTPADRATWREDLNPRIDAVRRLAIEFSTDLIPLDGLFAQAATQAPAEFWAPDGVHPSLAGHQLMSQAWLRNAGIF